jgi:hypothetical protein
VIESYGYNTNDVIVKPKQGTVMAGFSIDSAMQNSTLYKITKTDVKDAGIVLSSGNYSRLSFNIDFESQLKDAPKGALLALLERRSSK